MRLDQGHAHIKAPNTIVVQARFHKTQKVIVHDKRR